MEKIKKVLVSSLFLTFAITASAQLKVYSNGNVAIKRTLSDNPHSLNIGDGGIAESDYQIPLFSRVNTSSWGSYNIGIDGFSFPSISGDIGHGRAYGVRGMAGRASRHLWPDTLTSVLPITRLSVPTPLWIMALRPLSYIMPMVNES